MNKYSGDDDICIGVPTANRENSRIEEVIRQVKAQMEDVFALKVPLVVDVGAGVTWGDAHT